MTIKNKKFRKAMKEAGLESVQLEKGNGYFWIWSTDEEMSDLILSKECSSIYENDFNHQSIDKWVHDIQYIIYG